MSREKTERLFNLTLALLGTRNFLTKSQILTSVQGYDGPSESADRMFERDKDDLRELGIPIEVKQIDPLFDDEPGYRIDRKRYQLPPLLLSPREMALLSIAAQAWEQAALAGPAIEGLRKLIAAGADPEPDFHAVLAPSLSTHEPAFSPLWEAVRDCVTVKMEYRRAGEKLATERTVDPWGLLARNGVWYVIGRDHDQDSVRVYRLSRINKLRHASKPRSFEVPPHTDIWAHARLLDSSRSEAFQAKLSIQPDRALGLRRHATHLEADIYIVEYRDEANFAGQLAAFGDSVEVLEPEELRARTKALLEEAVRRYG